MKGRKRHILVDTLGLMICQSGGEPNRRAKGNLRVDQRRWLPGTKAARLARERKRDNGWKLLIVKRSQHAFKITGLTSIVELTFAWLGRNRRFSKEYEYRMQISETLLEIASTCLMLNRLMPA